MRKWVSAILCITLIGSMLTGCGKKRGWKGNGIKNRNGNCKNTGFTGSIRGTDNNSILEWVDRL